MTLQILRTDTQIIHKDSISTSQSTQAVSSAQTGPLILCMYIIGVSCATHTEKNIAPSGKEHGVFSVTANGTFSYQWTFKKVNVRCDT